MKLLTNTAVARGKRATAKDGDAAESRALRAFQAKLVRLIGPSDEW